MSITGPPRPTATLRVDAIRALMSHRLSFLLSKGLHPPISACVEAKSRYAINIENSYIEDNQRILAMAKADAASPIATPPSALKRTSSSAQNMKNQRSILGFFQKSSPATPSSKTQACEPASSPAQRASEQRGVSAGKQTPKRSFSSFAQDLSPVPSSDLPVPDEDDGTLKV